MPGPVPGRQRDGWRVVRRQHALLPVKPPDENLVQAQVRVQYESAGGISMDPAGVGPVMPAESGAFLRGTFGLGGADIVGGTLYEGGVSLKSFGYAMLDPNRTAEIICH